MYPENSILFLKENWMDNVHTFIINSDNNALQGFKVILQGEKVSAFVSNYIFGG